MTLPRSSRPRPCISDRDRGTTLAELVVAMAVFGVLATFLATTVVQTTRLARDAGIRELTAQRASVALSQVSKDLRTALPVGPPTGTRRAFITATPAEVVFHSSVDPSPVRERLYVSGGALLRETKIPDDGTSYPDLRYDSTDPARTRTRKVVHAGLQDPSVLFTYFLRGTATPVTTVASADLPFVTAVEVRLSVDGDGAGGLKPVVLRSTVRPYNR